VVCARAKVAKGEAPWGVSGVSHVPSGTRCVQGLRGVLLCQKKQGAFWRRGCDGQCAAHPSGCVVSETPSLSGVGAGVVCMVHLLPAAIHSIRATSVEGSPEGDGWGHLACLHQGQLVFTWRHGKAAGG
jgi:hypothetical protein